MIPCMMMVLGAVLYKGPGGANVPSRLILGVAAVRLLLIPCLGRAFRRTPCSAVIWILNSRDSHTNTAEVMFSPWDATPKHAILISGRDSCSADRVFPPGTEIT
jgi:predicted permease